MGDGSVCKWEMLGVCRGRWGRYVEVGVWEVCRGRWGRYVEVGVWEFCANLSVSWCG